MKRIITVIAAGTMLAAIASCATEPGGDDSNDIVGGSNVGTTAEQKVKLEDGRTVTCLVWYSTSKAGFSCDWANAK